jgi:hypothetical protein
MAYSQHIYIITNLDVSRIKIGISQDIEGRIKTLQNAGGCKMRLAWSSGLINNAAFIESILHRKFKEYRYLGEWFNIDLSEAITEAVRLVESEGRKPNDKNIILYKKPVIKKKKVKHNKPEKKRNDVKNLNIGKYKRVKPGIYQDKNGKFYSIKYKMDGSGWSVLELEKVG